MAKLTDQPSLTAVDGEDLMHVVDVSDTTSGAAGTSKRAKMTDVYNNIVIGTQDRIKLSSRGSHLTTEVVGDTTVYMHAGQTVDNTGTGPVTECRQQALESRVVTHGNSASSWTSAKSVVIGDRIRPTDAKATGYVYIATVGGTTGATEPATWPTGVGSTVADNGITWTRNVVLDKSGPAKDGAYPEVVDKFDQEWTSSAGAMKYSYNVVPQQDYILKRIYYKLGPSMIWDDDCSVRVTAHRGTDETGTKIYDRTLSNADAANTGQTVVPGGELFILVDNIAYSEGEELHWVIELITADPGCKLAIMTNAGFASPWRAVDRQIFTHVGLVPVDTIFAPVSFSAPVVNATGVSLTPTVTTLQGSSRRSGFHGAPNTSASGGVQGTALQFTLPANALGSSGILKGSFFLNQTGSATTTPWFFFEVGSSGTQGVLACPTAPGRFHVDLELIALSSGSQQTLLSRTDATITDMRAHTIDLSNPVLFTVFLSGGAGGTTTLEAYDIQVFNNEVGYQSYTHGGTEVKIKNLAQNAFVSSGSNSGLSAAVSTALAGATNYRAYARHKTSTGIWLPWTAGPAFTTLFNININVLTSQDINGTNTSLVAGDLMEFFVGETANASGFDFHIAGQSVEFPPVAYDSGEFRFTDSTGAALLFRIDSVTGTTPNRTAQCIVEINAQVISNGMIKLAGAGTPASNVSQLSSVWPPVAGTGGTVTTIGNERVHVFNASGTFVAPNGATSVRALVVAGGGGGGVNGGGGGGAGGYQDVSGISLTAAQSVTVTVGAAGAAGSGTNRGGSGGNSIFSTVTSNGGGGGGSRDSTQGAGAAGGSGGGGGGNDATQAGGAGNTPSTTPSQGNNGGSNFGAGVSQVGGGGGGAGAAGANATSGQAGAGGNGATSNITGSSVVYAGGGGGSRTVNGSAGAGGTGGGGAGNATGAGVAGTNNLGGGGGAGGPGGAGAAGGSGVVIVRYTMPAFSRPFYTDKFVSVS